VQCRLTNICKTSDGEIRAVLVDDIGKLMISGPLDYIIKQVEIFSHRLMEYPNFEEITLC
jgi:hypothetical protein